MKKILLFLFCLLTSYLTQAQTDFRSGYVISANGDTIRGEVDYRGAQRNAILTRFRVNGTVTEYHPAQLRGYGFSEGKAYHSATVAVADNPAQPVFLEVIVAGPASLLYMRDQSGANRMYLRMAAGDAQALEQTTEHRQINGTNYEQKNNAYQRVLAAAMQNCLAVQPELNKLRYSRDAIASVVNTYNGCVGSGPASLVAEKSQRNTFRLDLLAGGEVSRLYFNSFDANRSFTASSQVVPVVGLGGQVQLTGINQHLAVRLEALYEASASYSAEYEYNHQDGFRRHQQAQVKLSSIRIPLFLRYTLPGRRLQPFAQVGVSASHFLTNRNEGRFYYIDRPAFPDYTSWSALIESPRQIDQGALGSIGLNFTPANGHTIAAELRYERSKGFSNSFGTSTNMNRFFFLLGYGLTK